MTDVFETAIVALGHELRRRGMTHHLDHLRAYYAEFRHQQRRPHPGRWTTANVVTWLCLLQIPPFDRVYPARVGSSGCPKCGTEAADKFGSYVEMSFVGGYLSSCRTCGTKWLTPMPHEVAAPSG